jgi:hypothetical protein
MRKILVFVLSSLVPALASARTMEAGAVSLSAGLGPAFKLGSTLNASGGYLMAFGQGEYNLSNAVSALGTVELGLSGTVPLRLHVGGRYRLVGLDLPISPYAQAQVTVGRLYDVINTNLTYVGFRLGAGADYFLTAKISGGLTAFLDLGSTTGVRPAFYGLSGVLLYATYAF